MVLDQTTLYWIIGGVVVLAAILAFVFLVVLPQQQRRQLREDFGPEYERTVNRYGDQEVAETDLKERKERVSKLRLQSLPEIERARFADQWRRIQARFVDEPTASIREADQLVADVMRARGYPVEDFERQAGDISVSMPNLAESYRSAHAIFLRTEQGDVNTEDLRQAVVYYRAVFATLLEEEPLRRTA